MVPKIYIPFFGFALKRDDYTVMYYKKDIKDIHKQFVKDGFGRFVDIYYGPLHTLDDEVIGIKLTLAGRIIAEQLWMPS